MNEKWVEIVGYLASLLIVLGFIPKNILKIRLINFLGCVFFVIYGIYKGYLWPIIIPNLIICFIQVYYLLQKEEKK
nr:uroporphyrinogen decarboxylase [Elizabethkingia argenteiflava]